MNLDNPKPVVHVLAVYEKGDPPTLIHTFVGRSPLEVAPNQTHLEFLDAEGRCNRLTWLSEVTRSVIEEEDRIVVRLEILGKVKPLPQERVDQLKGKAGAGDPYRS